MGTLMIILSTISQKMIYLSAQTIDTNAKDALETMMANRKAMTPFNDGKYALNDIYMLVNKAPENRNANLLQKMESDLLHDVISDLIYISDKDNEAFNKETNHLFKTLFRKKIDSFSVNNEPLLMKDYVHYVTDILQHIYHNKDNFGFSNKAKALYEARATSLAKELQATEMEFPME